MFLSYEQSNEMMWQCVLCVYVCSVLCPMLCFQGLYPRTTLDIQIPTTLSWVQAFSLHPGPADWTERKAQSGGFAWNPQTISQVRFYINVEKHSALGCISNAICRHIAEWECRATSSSTLLSIAIQQQHTFPQSVGPSRTAAQAICQGASCPRNVL